MNLIDLAAKELDRVINELPDDNSHKVKLLYLLDKSKREYLRPPIYIETLEEPLKSAFLNKDNRMIMNKMLAHFQVGQEEIRKFIFEEFWIKQMLHKNEKDKKKILLSMLYEDNLEFYSKNSDEIDSHRAYLLGWDNPFYNF
jgi:hypothetical protein